jgi:C1q domain
MLSFILSFALLLTAPVNAGESFNEQTAHAGNRPVFYAEMKERRTTDNSRRGGELLQAYTRVEKNEGQVFDPATGIFTVPADGIYHLTGRFTIGCYQCRTREFLDLPVSFDVTVMKNNSPTYHRFMFPVDYTGKESINPNKRAHEFNVLLQLKAGDQIRLRYESKKCSPVKEAYLYEATFSGMQVN